MTTLFFPSPHSRHYYYDSLICCISSKLPEITRVAVFEETVILESVSYGQRHLFLTTDVGPVCKCVLTRENLHRDKLLKLLFKLKKLDGVSPVDNRPSTDKLHLFVKKKKKKKNVKCEM